MIAMNKATTKAAEKIVRGRKELLAGMRFLSETEDATRKFYQPGMKVPGV
jgi:hypothetical protein